MMTKKRKVELFDSRVEVLYEHLHPDDLGHIFIDVLGFTPEECEEYDLPVVLEEE